MGFPGKCSLRCPEDIRRKVEYGTDKGPRTGNYVVSQDQAQKERRSASMGFHTKEPHDYRFNQPTQKHGEPELRKTAIRAHDESDGMKGPP